MFKKMEAPGVSSVGLAIGLSLLFGSQDMSAQAVSRLRSERCDGCRLQMQRVFELPANTQIPGVIKDVILVDSLIILSIAGPNEPPIAVDLETGRVRSWGRAGHGPGEFIGPLSLGRTGSRVVVYDPGNARFSVHTIEGSVVREVGGVALPLLDFAMLPGLRFVVNADIRTPQQAGLPLHLVDSTGSIVRSFGLAEPRLELGLDDQMVRRLTTGSQLWSAPAREYRLSRHSIGDGGTDTFERQARWFRKDRGATIPDAREPPATTIADIWEDPEGRVWVLVTVPDRRWRESLETFEFRGQGFVRFTDVDRYVDTIIEVIDPSSRRVLHSARSDRFLASFVGNYHVAALKFDEHSPPLSLWRLTLTTP